jgi:hypothetical protein
MEKTANAFDPEDIPSFVNLTVPSLLNTQMPSNWCVSSTGDDARDLALGTALANEGIRFSNKVNNNNCLLYAIAEIGRRGYFGPVEVAFLDRILYAARTGVMN